MTGDEQTSASPYTSSIHVGHCTVTAINEGSGIYRAPVIDDMGAEVDPFGPDNPDGFPIGFHVFHIRLPEESILVDAGFDDPDSDWGRRFGSEFFLRRSPGLSAALNDLDESRETITHIALTHTHFDHVAGVTEDRSLGKEPRFPRARVLLGRDDHARIGVPSEDPAARDIAERLNTIRDRGLLEAVDDGYEIARGVTMMHTGGESPGHSVVSIASGQHRVLLVGDLFHYPFEIEHPEWMPPWSDGAALLDGRVTMMRQATDTGAIVAFSHHPFPPWGRIFASHGGYAWRPLSAGT